MSNDEGSKSDAVEAKAGIDRFIGEGGQTVLFDWVGKNYFSLLRKLSLPALSILM